MVASGDWITPTYNGENRFDKPILFYWLMAIPFKIFGVNEFSARFPSALSASLLVLSLFLFLRHLKDEKRAFCAAVSLMLSVYYFVYSHAAVTDMALTLFISLSLISFYLSVEEKRSPEKVDRYRYGFYFFSALAFLTKGLIGILFPFGIAMFYLLFTEGISGIRKVLYAKGIVLFVIVSSPWYIAQTAINGQDFIRQFFIKHHFMRYTDVISGHSGPVYYYIPVLLIGLLPWIAFLPAGIRSGLKERDKLSLFAVIWTLFVVLFFSFSTTKLPNYILPAVPALALLISSGLTAQNGWARYANLWNALIAVVAGSAFLISKKYLSSFGISDTGWTTAAGVILFGVAIVHFYSFFTRKTRLGLISILTATFLFLFPLKVLPLANQYLQGTLHKYSLYAKDRLLENDRLVTYGINNPSIVFYSGHRTVNAGSEHDLMSLVKEDGRLLVISKAKEIAILKNLGFHVLEEDGRYAILEGE